MSKAEPHETSREGNQEGGTHHPVDHQTLNLIAQNQGHNNTIDIPDIRRENPYIDLLNQLPILQNLPQQVLNDNEIFAWGPNFTQGGRNILKDMMFSNWPELQRPRYDAISKLDKVVKIMFQDQNFPFEEQIWVMTALANSYDRGVSGSLAFDDFGFKPDKHFFGELYVRLGHEDRAAVLLKSIGVLPNCPYQSEWARKNFYEKGNKME
ncbi:hypothetical protein ACHAPC_010298 [Botrytis cinerea]